MAAAAGVKIEGLRAAVDELDHISGSRTHLALAEHISISSVPSSVIIINVPSLDPQAMSISTSKLLLPFGEGTLDDDDDLLLTREPLLPFLGLGTATAPYSGTGGGFPREHAMDVKIDIPSGAANADARGGNLASAVIGIAAASSAVTMVAAGAVSPPLAFGLFVLLLGSLSLAVSGVRGA
uniref:Uncharacterized protein n=1 Tax=Oryza punctata TaxID=4537 RepID=A0A0E0LRY9_ORYPU